MSAPERIWIDAWGGNWSPVSGGTQGIEYVRADLCPTPPAIDPKVTALVEALRDLCEVTDAAIDPRYSTAEEWEWRDEALVKARAAIAAWEAQ